MKKLVLALAVTFAMLFPLIALASKPTPIPFDANQYQCVDTFTKQAWLFNSPENAARQISVRHTAIGSEAAALLERINNQYGTNFPLTDYVIIWTSAVMEQDYFTFGFQNENCVIYAVAVPRNVIDSILGQPL